MKNIICPELGQKGIDVKKKIICRKNYSRLTANGDWDRSVKFYDISLTRNVVQMILALALLVWIMMTNR
jgi:hypothetical protein